MSFFFFFFFQGYAGAGIVDCYKVDGLNWSASVIVGAFFPTCSPAHSGKVSVAYVARLVTNHIWIVKWDDIQVDGLLQGVVKAKVQTKSAFLGPVADALLGRSLTFDANLLCEHSVHRVCAHYKLAKKSTRIFSRNCAKIIAQNFTTT